WLFTFAVKSQCSTLDTWWKLPSWSTVGAEGLFGGAVKCIDIEKNTNSESTLLGRH
ncbi:hypothetical protein HN51_011907, partial [Arachis hypogaea]